MARPEVGGHRFRTRKSPGEAADRPDRRRNRGGTPKTKNAYRTLPLAEDTIQVLKQQRKKGDSSPRVFLSSFGGPISLGSVLHMLHRVLKRAGLPRVRFHDLRHTFATLALQNGVDIKAVSGMMGHFSAGFTLDTYAHVTTAAQKEAARATEEVLTAAL
ncbi:site-specific integrase [Dysosmobacter sp.]|uniref:site-specific integrase n=1 Tax=Dysosmobacter sp. TaxID=2591382 RepID=UPI003AF16DD8